MKSSGLSPLCMARKLKAGDCKRRPGDPNYAGTVERLRGKTSNLLNSIPMGTVEGDIFRFVADHWGAKSGRDIALKLAEETGEVAGAVNRLDEGGELDSIADELGDVLIVASQLAFLLGSTLEQIRADRWKEIQERIKS